MTEQSNDESNHIDDDFQLIVNGKGGFSMMYKGAKFYKNSTHKDTTYFRCATAHIKGKNNDTNGRCPGAVSIKN